jgi:hypothetical protein
VYNAELEEIEHISDFSDEEKKKVEQVTKDILEATVTKGLSTTYDSLYEFATKAGLADDAATELAASLSSTEEDLAELGAAMLAEKEVMNAYYDSMVANAQ